MFLFCYEGLSVRAWLHAWPACMCVCVCLCVCMCVCVYTKCLLVCVSPGDMLQYEEGQSPLDSLEQVAIHYASAIKLKPKDPRFHFLLGQALEEQHRATEMYGLKKRVIYRYDCHLFGMMVQC